MYNVVKCLVILHYAWKGQYAPAQKLQYQNKKLINQKLSKIKTF